MARNKQPKSINLLQPVYSPTDIVSKVYTWLTTIGKYLLIFVEIIVLGVFFSRFILDEKNNDLSEEIKSQISFLDDSAWKAKDLLYTNTQTLLTDIEVIRMGQKFNSELITEIANTIPSNLVLKNFSFNGNRVSLSLEAADLETVRVYETALKGNSRYSDVSFNIRKDEEGIKISVSFTIIQEKT